jgi:acyl-CoA hydrolase
MLYILNSKIKNAIKMALVVFFSVIMALIPLTLTPNLELKLSEAKADDAGVAAGIQARFKMKSKPVKIGKVVKVSIKIKYNGEKLANAQVRVIVKDSNGISVYDLPPSLTNNKGKVKLLIPTSGLSPGSIYSVYADAFIAGDWYPVGSGSFSTRGAPIPRLNRPPVIQNAYAVDAYGHMNSVRTGETLTVYAEGYDPDRDSIWIRCVYFASEFKALERLPTNTSMQFLAMMQGTYTLTSLVTYTIETSLVDEHGAESGRRSVTIVVRP